jgi:hypothetical protein
MDDITPNFKNDQLDQDKDNIYAVKNNPITQSSTNVICNNCTSLFWLQEKSMSYSLRKNMYFVLALAQPERKAS